MSLEVKIGQMLLIGFRGLTEHSIVQDIWDKHLGGVLLFGYDVPTQTPLRNIESPAQVKASVAALRTVSSIPLLITIDQEGGRISRLKEEFGFSPTVSALDLGTLNDGAFTRKHAAAMAQTLAQLGINLNLAPVVDLNTNPHGPIIGKLERSFSADPDVVTTHALEFIRVHHEQGVFAPSSIPPVTAAYRRFAPRGCRHHHSRQQLNIRGKYCCSYYCSH